MSTMDLAFKSFEVCETRLCYQDQSVTFVNVYRPRLAERISCPTRCTWTDEFPDLPGSFVSCDRLFVLGDINFSF